MTVEASPQSPNAKAGSRQALLRGVLQRDRDVAWQSASYERTQRDDYTSKLRFGLVTLNAASLVTVLNFGGLLSKLDPGVLLSAAGFFLGGTILAGYSLFAHQTHLIELTGDLSVRAMTLDQALVLNEFDPGTDQHKQFGQTLDELRETAPRAFRYSPGAFTLQAWSGGAWIGGVTMLTVVKVGEYLLSWDALTSWVGALFT